jgi:hypothetical protein
MSTFKNNSKWWRLENWEAALMCYMAALPMFVAAKEVADGWTLWGAILCALALAVFVCVCIPIGHANIDVPYRWRSKVPKAWLTPTEVRSLFDRLISLDQEADRLRARVREIDGPQSPLLAGTYFSYPDP